LSNREARQLLIGFAFGDLQQIVEELVFSVRAGQVIVSFVMGMTQVAGCRLLPPLKCSGAHSRTKTDAPDSLAVMAAHKAALPPPMIKTSHSRSKSIS
jgi:hypothetical protein